MRVLIDHQIFSYQKYGGISRYFAELMKYYSTDNQIDYLLGVKESANESLINTGLAQKHNISIPASDAGFCGLALKYLKNNLYTKKLMRSEKIDIFHPTFFFPGLARYAKETPTVITVLDMIPELFPEAYPKNSLYAKHITHTWIKGKKELVENAQAIIAISEKTKSDLVETYGIDEAKVKVIYLGNSLFPEEDLNSNLKLPEKYLLFVGTRNSYKNFTRFLNASAKILQKDHDLNIVCIGGGSFTPTEQTLIHSLGIESKVHQYNVTDGELYYAYRHAQAFVFPSLYEGFGIPIVEAFVSKCPLILSNTSCFPEIAGDAAIYFNPEDEESIRNSIEKTIYDPELKEQLRAKGFERGKEFTWGKTAQQTIEIYKSIL
jgi:glycosyltransferase involved in cell wall biosynthesis